jgi:3',5'-cyclic AMP phosphodiesterase CpdA
MQKLLQISDPHFGTVQPAVREALVRLAHGQRPDVLVLSGDITQRARPSQFRQAREFCDRLKIPHMLSVPGNHDIPLFNVYQRLFQPYAHYLRDFGPDVEACLHTPMVQVIGVKTTRRSQHKNGEVSGPQIDRVAALLKTAEVGQLRIVVVHQPVYVLRAEDEHDRLRGWKPAVHAWAAAGADLVMGGHIHLPYVSELSAHVPGLGRRLWCVQAGTALSSRVRWESPNSVNLLCFDAVRQPVQCHLQRWDYSSASSQFEMVNTTELVLDRPTAP